MGYKEEELTSLEENTPITSDNPAEKLTDEQLEQQIKENQESIASQTEQVPQPPEKAQVEEPKKEIAPAVTIPEGQAKQNEQKKEDKGAFETLKEKKGLENVDELAKSYTELEKEFHKKSQELAQAKKQQFHQQGTVPLPQTQEVSVNEQFLNKFYSDPIGTLIEVQDVILKPVKETTKQMELRNEIVRLSSTPKTADFNSSEIQQEIKSIINENPQKYTGDLVNNLEDLYWIARGRLGITNTKPVVSETPATPIPPPVEGTSRPVPEKPFNPWTAPEEDLLSVIKDLQRQLR